MKRTKEEYEAAAVLLDMIYDSGIHIFFTPTADKCFDADTLELIYQDLPDYTSNENRMRFKQFLTDRRNDAHS